VNKDFKQLCMDRDDVELTHAENINEKVEIYAYQQ